MINNSNTYLRNQSSLKDLDDPLSSPQNRANNSQFKSNQYSHSELNKEQEYKYRLKNSMRLQQLSDPNAYFSSEQPGIRHNQYNSSTTLRTPYTQNTFKTPNNSNRKNIGTYGSMVLKSDSNKKDLQRGQFNAGSRDTLDEYIHFSGNVNQNQRDIEQQELKLFRKNYDPIKMSSSEILQSANRYAPHPTYKQDSYQNLKPHKDKKKKKKKDYTEKRVIPTSLNDLEELKQSDYTNNINRAYEEFKTHEDKTYFSQPVHTQTYHQSSHFSRSNSNNCDKPIQGPSQLRDDNITSEYQQYNQQSLINNVQHQHQSQQHNHLLGQQQQFYRNFPTLQRSNNMHSYQTQQQHQHQLNTNSYFQQPNRHPGQSYNSYIPQQQNGPYSRTMAMGPNIQSHHINNTTQQLNSFLPSILRSQEQQQQPSFGSPEFNQVLANSQTSIPQEILNRELPLNVIRGRIMLDPNGGVTVSVSDLTNGGEATQTFNDISLFRELGNINRMLGNLIVGNPIRGARNRQMSMLAEFLQETFEQFISEQQGNTPKKKGLDQEAIDNLPLVQFKEIQENKVKDANQSQNNQNTCYICLGEFTEEDYVRQLDCQHNFHKECLDPWLLTKAECPTCRKSVQKENDNNE